MSIANKLTYLNTTKSKIKDVINMSEAGITDDTFRSYPQKLYDGYINVLKDKNTLLDNMPKGTSTGTINNAADLPIYEDKMSKESTQETKILPDGYTQVDYIQSSGTQYIDTGVIGEAEWNIKLQYTNIIDRTQIFLGRSSDAGYWFGILNTGNDGYYAFGVSSKSTVLGTTLGNAVITTGNQRISGTINDQNIPSRALVTQQYINNEYRIFGEKTSTNFNSYCKLYSLKCFQNNELVRDFIPCYRNSDNEVGLYDIVNNVFYTNQGTGSFTYGSVVTIPNPDYPQEVKTVKGYRNLFDKNGTLSNGYLKVDGTVQSANGYKVSDYIDISGFSNITISGNAGGSEVNSFYDENKTFISSNGMSANTSKTISVPSNAKYLRCTINDNNLSQYQVVDDDSVLPYVPYGSNYIYKKIVGKQLFNKDTIISGKYIDANGNFVNDSSNFIGDYILINENKSYYLSATSGSAKRIAYYDENKNFISRQLISTTRGNLIIPTNSKYVRLSCYNTDLDSLQLEQGTQTTSYEPYKENIITLPLRDNEIAGTSDYKDEYIIDKNGHCWINKKFAKIDSYNGETITTDYWSTTGGLDTGATIYYVLATPEPIDLNYTVDITLFKGINNISNSEDMDMEIKYIKDTYE